MSIRPRKITDANYRTVTRQLSQVPLWTTRNGAFQILIAAGLKGPDVQVKMAAIDDEITVQLERGLYSSIYRDDDISDLLFLTAKSIQTIVPVVFCWWNSRLGVVHWSASLVDAPYLKNGNHEVSSSAEITKRFLEHKRVRAVDIVVNMAPLLATDSDWESILPQPRRR